MADKIARSAERHQIPFHGSMCNAVVIAFSKARMQSRAEEEYAKFRQHGVIGASQMYTCFMACSLRTKNFDKAMTALQDMITAGLQVSEEGGTMVFRGMGTVNNYV